MFATIRKHQRWLLMVIIVAVIISFVIYFSPNQPSGGLGRGEAKVGDLDGRPVSEQQVREASLQAQLSGFLRFGDNYRRAAQTGFDMKRETLQRLFLARRLKEYGIEVSNGAVAAWIREYLKDPQTGNVNFDGFVQNALKPAGFTDSQFFEFVRHEVGLQELERLIGISGQLVTPQEAEAAFRRENETLAISLVSFAGSNYLAGIILDDAKLGEFFTNRLAAYRIPERLALSFVRFGTTNFTAQAEEELAARVTLAEEIEQLYLQQGPDAFRDEVGAPLAKEAALVRIREATVRQRALQLAAQQANEFASELYQMEPVSAANLGLLAQRKGLTIVETEPFVEGTQPLALSDINPNALAQALARVTAEQPFLTPMAGPQGVVVAVVAGRTPSTVPSFDTVRARVIQDFNQSTSTEAARNAGRAFHQTATNLLAQGQTFADAVAAAGVTASEVSFSLSSTTIAGLDGRLNPSQIKNVASRLSAGQVSDFIPTLEGGFVLAVQERIPAANELVQAGLNSYLGELRQEREREAFNSWFVTEFENSGARQLGERIGL